MVLLSHIQVDLFIFLTQWETETQRCLVTAQSHRWLMAKLVQVRPPKTMLCIPTILRIYSLNC